MKPISDFVTATIIANWLYSQQDSSCRAPYVLQPLIQGPPRLSGADSSSPVRSDPGLIANGLATFSWLRPGRPTTYRARSCSLASFYSLAEGAAFSATPPWSTPQGLDLLAADPRPTAAAGAIVRERKPFVTGDAIEQLWRSRRGGTHPSMRLVPINTRSGGNLQ